MIQHINDKLSTIGISLDLFEIHSLIFVLFEVNHHTDILNSVGMVLQKNHRFFIIILHNHYRPILTDSTYKI